MPTPVETTKLSRPPVYLVASGDLRLSANQKCWPAQQQMEDSVRKAIESVGRTVVRAHDYDEQLRHGFISSQKQGIEIFRRLDPEAPIVVAEAVWQYSHHVLPGLMTHRGPILTLANWSGAWPGLVGMLNLNGSLTKAGVAYSTLWSENFTDDFFTTRLSQWLDTGCVTYDVSHVHPRWSLATVEKAMSQGTVLAQQLLREKAIMGVFDEGCMGMFNAIIPDHLLNPTGVFKERLSQSALYFESTQVDKQEARQVRHWMEARGMIFHTGPNHDQHLTDEQILRQCQMYIAAIRIADDFGCELIGIQYQQGLKDLMPASDLAEGMLNNSDRPPVRSRDGSRILFDGRPVIHFNEVDECAGLDALITFRVQRALGGPVESTLHDIRWGDADRSGTVKDYVWVFEISGAAPPAHFIGAWAGAEGFRQPAMYFPNGGSTLRGISRPGEIVWSRIYVVDNALNMDIGRGAVVELPAEETERRWKATTREWPIMHAVLYGVSRDQLMARHKANHIQVFYGHNAASADAALQTKVEMARALGIEAFVCGQRNRNETWPYRAAD
jgi:L-fucose isomerase-like protein